MRLITLSSIALVFACSAMAQDITLRINPGLWENTADISVEMGMGGQTMSIPVRVDTVEECVSEAEATLDLDDLAEDGCTISNVSQSGQTVSANLSCATQGVEMDGTMTTTISNGGNSSSTTISATGSSPMGQMKMSGTVVGQRIGGC